MYQQQRWISILMFVVKNLLKMQQIVILDYLKDALNDDNLFHIIVGHDSNIAMLMSALNIDYKVNTKHCIEKYPVGSKLIIRYMKMIATKLITLILIITL